MYAQLDVGTYLKRLFSPSSFVTSPPLTLGLPSLTHVWDRQPRFNDARDDL